MIGVKTMRTNEEFRFLRDWKRVSQRCVAEAVGAHANSIVRYERGQGQILSSTFEKMMVLLYVWRWEYCNDHGITVEDYKRDNELN